MVFIDFLQKQLLVFVDQTFYFAQLVRRYTPIFVRIKMEPQIPDSQDRRHANLWNSLPFVKSGK